MIALQNLRFYYNILQMYDEEIEIYSETCIHYFSEPIHENKTAVVFVSFPLLRYSSINLPPHQNKLKTNL